MRNALVIALLLAAVAGAAFAGKFTGSDTGAPKDSDKDAAPKVPVLKAPVMFNTPEADLIMSRINLYPKGSPLTWDLSKLPVQKNSKQIIASIGAKDGLHGGWGFPFIIVPGNQPKVEVRLLKYARESDPGPYPVPDMMPIQGWPISVKDLAKIQREGEGDRHAFVLDPYNGKLYEFYQARKADAGWEASNEATFDLTSNKLRPKGWTSADAAGLSYFLTLIRYDDVERGIVAHAMRMTVKTSRREYIYPARHFAGDSTDPNDPAMGQRLRLRADFDVSKFPRHAQAILLGMKKYGLIVADDGNAWDLAITADKRIEGLGSLSAVKGSDFEVVDVSALVAEASAKNP